MKIGFFFALAALPALAAPKSWIPIHDSRFEFSNCGANGMINLNKPSEMQGCLGTVAGKKERVLVIRPANRKTVDVYKVLDEKLLRSIVDPDGGAHGEQVWEATIKEYDPATDQLSRRGTKIKETQSWEYSDGFFTIQGKSPKGYDIWLSLQNTDKADPSRE